MKVIVLKVIVYNIDWFIKGKIKVLNNLKIVVVIIDNFSDVIIDILILIFDDIKWVKVKDGNFLVYIELL